ncbi:MAG: heme-binding protein [Haloferacaceae archaeon]
MRSPTKAALGALAGLATLWVGWGAYVRTKTERVPYETLDRFDGVELRRYPRSVLVETTASDQVTAFRRLFRYISGANQGDAEIAMTAPVSVRGESISMTAPVRTLRGGGRVSTSGPVRTDRVEGAVTMAFYLPPEYAPENAPVPTDPAVRLVVEPPRTVAVRRFSWYATEGRVTRERRRLLEELADREVRVRGEPVLLQYDDPWTPPFMRTNEVEVAVADAE